jgi:hypothetical protein
MKMTLSLDKDVADRLDRLCRASGLTHEYVVNNALRLGLHQIPPIPEPGGETYRIRPVSLGRCRLASLDDVTGALEG